MDQNTASDEVLKKLRDHNGKMSQTDLLCSFTSGEEPGDNLSFIIQGGLHILEITKKVVIEDGNVRTC